MKRVNKSIILSVLMMAIFVNIYSQSSNVTSAWNYLKYGELDKAKKSIDDASVNESTSQDPKTWYYKGQVYEKIAISDKPEYKALSNNAVEESIKAYIKCIELDKKNKYSQEAEQGTPGKFMGLNGFSQYNGNQGVKNYNEKKYAEALPFFEIYIKIGDELAKVRNKKSIDTPFIYYAGTAAYLSTPVNTEKTKYHYLRLVNDYKYAEPSVYQILSEIYKKENNTNEALAILEKGLQNASDKKNIMIDRLNIFINNNQTDKALSEGLKAIDMNPDNVSLYIAMGIIYQNMKKEKEADDLYQKALARDPNNFTVNNVLGTNYYNMGADKYNASIEIKDMKKSAAVEAEAKVIWKKGLPYLEKAHQLNAKDKETIKLLMEVYAKLDMLDKATEMRKKL